MEMSTTTLAIFAVVAAMGLVGVAAIAVISIPQEAAAGCEKGKAVSQAFNASQGRCFRP